MNKLIKMKEKMELRKASKKGAASIETIIVSGLLIALAVGIILGFNSTIQSNADQSNTAISGAVDTMETELSEDLKENGAK